MKEGKRKGETEGKRLSPGERMINWCKAIGIIVGLFGTGWISNTDMVRQYYAEETETAVSVEPIDVAPVVQNAPPQIIERTIIKEKDCGITEVMQSHINELH